MSRRYKLIGLAAVLFVSMCGCGVSSGSDAVITGSDHAAVSDAVPDNEQEDDSEYLAIIDEAAQYAASVYDMATSGELYDTDWSSYDISGLPIFTAATDTDVAGMNVVGGFSFEFDTDNVSFIPFNDCVQLARIPARLTYNGDEPTYVSYKLDITFDLPHEIGSNNWCYVSPSLSMDMFKRLNFADSLIGADALYTGGRLNEFIGYSGLSEEDAERIYFGGMPNDGAKYEPGESRTGAFYMPMINYGLYLQSSTWNSIPAPAEYYGIDVSEWDGETHYEDETKHEWFTDEIHHSFYSLSDEHFITRTWVVPYKYTFDYSYKLNEYHPALGFPRGS